MKYFEKTGVVEATQFDTNTFANIGKKNLKIAEAMQNGMIFFVDGYWKVHLSDELHVLQSGEYVVIRNGKPSVYDKDYFETRYATIPQIIKAGDSINIVNSDDTLTPCRCIYADNLQFMIAPIVVDKDGKEIGIGTTAAKTYPNNGNLASNKLISDEQ